MNKSTIIGFVIIAAIMFGFSWFQSSKVKEQMAEDAKAKTEQQIKIAEETIIASQQAELTNQQNNETVAVTVQETPKKPFTDSLLNAAYNDVKLNPGLYPQFATLSNDLVEMVFTTKGAQPYSVRLKEYSAYNPENPDEPKPLYFVRPGANDYNVSVDVARHLIGTKFTLNTKDFFFELDMEQSSDSVVVMKLPYEGGYIQQKYWIDQESYMLQNEMSFIGMNNLVDNITDSYKTD